MMFETTCLLRSLRDDLFVFTLYLNRFTEFLSVSCTGTVTLFCQCYISTKGVMNGQ